MREPTIELLSDGLLLVDGHRVFRDSVGAWVTHAELTVNQQKAVVNYVKLIEIEVHHPEKLN